MKTLYTITILTGLSLGLLHAQEVRTTPVGYVTHTLKAGQFNLIGLTMHEAVTVTGTFETVVGTTDGVSGATSTGTTFTDTDVDFDSLLTDGTTYIVEITSGSSDGAVDLTGTIQELVWTSPSATTDFIVTSDDLESGDNIDTLEYQIRPSTSLQDLFGATPSIASGATATASDIVWVPAGNGTFNRYFYRTSLGGSGTWYNIVDDEVVTESIPLVYTDGVMVEVKSTSTDSELVITGSVKTEAISFSVFTGFNLFSNVYPIGSTLQNCGLDEDLASGATASVSDIVWLPSENGGFVRYFYRTNLGGAQTWFNITDNVEVGDLEEDGVSLTSAFFVERKAGSDNFNLIPPSTYTNL
ncbi:MAG: hypothetical protein ACSHX0_07310 [Akkermansiaceae bacterium]